MLQTRLSSTCGYESHCSYYKGYETLEKNGIREFVLNSLLSNTIMSKSHGHGLPPTARKVKDMRFNGDIICKKAW